MSDSIDRTLAIATLVMAKETGSLMCKELKGVIEVLNRMPPAQQWIPCSERLPEDNRQVLIYAMSVHYALAKYDEMRETDGTYKKQWVTFDAWKPFYTIKEVIAWMPLPEPYREDDHEIAR